MDIKFKDPTSLNRWHVTDDVVMGGASSSSLSISETGTGIFRGNVSLENSGGFASVRYDLLPKTLAGHKSLRFRVRGDGKTYKAYLKEERSRQGENFQRIFQTVKGEWRTFHFEFTEFVLFKKGAPLNLKSEPEAKSISAFGFIIADKQAGFFQLEIEWIRAIKAEKSSLPEDGKEGGGK